MYSSESRNLLPGQKIYFASDFHLGIGGKLTSFQREKIILEWLNRIQHDAGMIFLVGDIFDYWFEYDQVVPKGYVRLLGKLAEFQDNGIEIIFYTGNHDMWMFRYLQDELGAKLYKEPVIWNIQGKKFFIGHGDGLGPGDHGYKLIKKIFNHPVSQWLFARIHPNTGIRLMRYFSSQSRFQNPNEEWDENKEWLVRFCRDFSQKEKIDYYVFGHRHLVIDFLLPDNQSRYINLGDWYQFFSYAVYDGEKMEIKFYNQESPKIISNYSILP
jgi:UDP-2,3-diacylglucosamine hydrolase